jgi:hypothetical protein
MATTPEGRHSPSSSKSLFMEAQTPKVKGRDGCRDGCLRVKAGDKV